MQVKITCAAIKGGVSSLDNASPPLKSSPGAQEAARVQ